MDFNSTIDLIIKELDEAREIIDDLKRYPGVPALQVELAKSKCKSAGEVIALLKNLSDNVAIAKEESINEKQPVHSQEDKVAPARSATDNPHREEKKKESKPVEFSSATIDMKEETKGPVKKTAESTIIADKFSHLSNRFNEQLGSMKGDEDISDHLKVKPLTSLSEAIGINDRFLFIREIFDGNKDAYTQAISRLDAAENLPDAVAVIMSYTGEKSENEAVRQLLDLVKRKLPSNE